MSEGQKVWDNPEPIRRALRHHENHRGEGLTFREDQSSDDEFVLEMRHEQLRLTRREAWLVSVALAGGKAIWLDKPRRAAVFWRALQEDGDEMTWDEEHAAAQEMYEAITSNEP